MVDKTMDELGKELFSSDFLKDASREYVLASFAGMAYDLAQDSGLSRREIARRMGNASTSTLQRLLDEAEANNVTLETLVRFGLACDHRLELSFTPLNQGLVLENARWESQDQPAPDSELGRALAA